MKKKVTGIELFSQRSKQERIEEMEEIRKEIQKRPRKKRQFPEKVKTIEEEKSPHKANLLNKKI